MIKPTHREIAKNLANTAHLILISLYDEPLDGDRTEELSIMFQEELDELNGNT